MNKELEKTVAIKNESFFSFASNIFENLNTWEPKTNYEKAIYTCLNGFSQSAINYTLSILHDFSLHENKVMPKAIMNRLFIRNCLEAYLVLNILLENPQYSDKFLQTKEDDNKRISLFLDASAEKRRFLKRFEWLPKIKRKRATSTKDLLNYLNFSDIDEAILLESFIKNLDRYIHPSFHYATSFSNNDNVVDIMVVYSLFVDEGLIDALKDSFEDTLRDKRMPLCIDFKSNYNFNNSLSKYLYKNEDSIINVYTLIDKLRSKKSDSYKLQSVIYLFYDLLPRYHDFLNSYSSNNSFLFFIQCRFILEALATLSILLDESEERNYIYHIHQNIKNYEASKATNIILEIEEPLEKENQENILKIREFYLNNFNIEVEENKINRLTGWALYLKKINNDFILNSPALITYLADEFLNESETNKLLSLYEISNAFSHITPYAFYEFNSIISIDEYYKLINSLFNKILDKIIVEFFDKKDKSLFASFL